VCGGGSGDRVLLSYDQLVDIRGVCLPSLKIRVRGLDDGLSRAAELHVCVCERDGRRGGGGHMCACVNAAAGGGHMCVGGRGGGGG
jgi:hypothetical protein